MPALHSSIILLTHQHPSLNRIPKLQKEVINQLTACRTELAALPPAVTADPASHVLSLVTSFCAAIRALVEGGPGTAALVQRNRASYAAFKRAVRATAPPFLPFPSFTEAPPHAFVYLALDLDEEEEDRFQVAGETETPGRRIMYLRDVKKFIAQSVHAIWFAYGLS